METNVQLKTVLHVGCGTYHPQKLHEVFKSGEWKELRYDIDPNVKPDVIGDITQMDAVASDSVDAVWSSHNLEHLYPHQVETALKEFYRVLKRGGFVLITLPDLQVVARFVAEGKLEDPIYQSPVGPISALDILYGYRPDLEKGNTFMAHKTGFTVETLARKLSHAGFQQVDVESVDFDLWASGFKV